jgi:hypothetical protein
MGVFLVFTADNIRVCVSEYPSTLLDHIRLKGGVTGMNHVMSECNRSRGRDAKRKSTEYTQEDTKHDGIDKEGYIRACDVVRSGKNSPDFGDASCIRVQVIVRRKHIL